MPVPLDKLKGLGLNLMPLMKDSKRPVLSAWTHLQDEKFDGKFPDDCNVAVICGESSGNTFVVDLDTEDIYNDIPETLRNTRTVKTGQGYHLYYHYVGLPPEGRKMDDDDFRHIDIKTHGGYVLAEGSYYVPTEKEKREHKYPKENENGFYYELVKDVPILTMDIPRLKEILKELGFNVNKKSIQEISKGVSEHDRNDSTFLYGCYLLKQGLDDEAIKIEMDKLNQKHDPPLPQSEIDIIYKSVIPRRASNPIEFDAKMHLKHMKKVAELNKITHVTMQEIRPELHEGILIEFDCMIPTVGDRKTYTKSAQFECYDCGDSVFKRCDELYQMKVPKCKVHGKNRLIDHSTKETGYIQQIRIEEFLENASHSSPIPFDAEILDENVGHAFMGDRKTIVAKFRSIPSKDGYNVIVFEIISMKDIEQGEGCMPDDEEKEKWHNNTNLFEDVTSSIIPEVLFNPLILKSLILYAAGGTTLNGKREDINAALIGDAQLAKSDVLLRFHKLLIGSGYTVGMKTSGAGLTIGMVKLYNGMSAPRAGFFPMHTNHHCIIDEGDKMKPEDQNACLDVMEQQTTTLTKNGVPSITLPAKCPLLFAGNPKGSKFNKKLPIMDNFNMSIPFVSRFDFVWCIVDSNDPKVDATIRECIKSFQDRKAQYMNVEELQRYFTYIQTIHAKVPESLYGEIDELHIKMRELNKLDGLPIGWRQYHGLFRLVTACASAHLRTEVNINDIKIVESIIKESFRTMRMDLDSGELSGSIIPKKITKETIFLEVWNECLDEEGTVGREEFEDKLGKKEPYNALNAPIEFKKWWDIGRIELDNETERFKMVST